VIRYPKQMIGYRIKETEEVLDPSTRYQVTFFKSLQDLIDQHQFCLKVPFVTSITKEE
jgi:hypothetical protein